MGTCVFVVWILVAFDVRFGFGLYCIGCFGGLSLCGMVLWLGCFLTLLFCCLRGFDLMLVVFLVIYFSIWNLCFGVGFFLG